MSQSESINELAAALSKCQSELKPVPKKTKGHFKGGYADLTDCWENCREALTKNGLAITQLVDENASGRLVMHTTLTHSSGQWMSSTMPIICKTPDDIQKVGSSVTYCRRYMMCSILGISPIEDDDGQAGKENDTPQIALITPEGIKELNELFVKAGKDVWERTRASFVKQYPNFRSLQDLTYNDYVRVKCDLIVETQNSEAQNESV